MNETEDNEKMKIYSLKKVKKTKSPKSPFRQPEILNSTKKITKGTSMTIFDIRSEEETNNPKIYQNLQEIEDENKKWKTLLIGPSKQNNENKTYLCPASAIEQTPPLLTKFDSTSK